MITKDEWLAELDRFMARRQPDDPGLTAEEWAEETGHCTDHVRKVLRQAHRRGCLVVGVKSTTNIRGRSCVVPVYRLKPADVAQT